MYRNTTLKRGYGGQDKQFVNVTGHVMTAAAYLLHCFLLQFRQKRHRGRRFNSSDNYSCRCVIIKGKANTNWGCAVKYCSNAQKCILDCKGDPEDVKYIRKKTLEYESLSLAVWWAESFHWWRPHSVSDFFVKVFEHVINCLMLIWVFFSLWYTYHCGTFLFNAPSNLFYSCMLELADIIYQQISLAVFTLLSFILLVLFPLLHPLSSWVTRVMRSVSHLLRFYCRSSLMGRVQFKRQAQLDVSFIRKQKLNGVWRRAIQIALIRLWGLYVSVSLSSGKAAREKTCSSRRRIL